MFPNEAITYFGEFTASTTSIFEDADNFTILNISSTVTNTNSPIFVRCGSQTIFSARQAGYKETFLNYECTSPLIFSKTGSNIGNVNVTYVPYLTSELGTSSVGYNPIANIASSSDVKIYGSISAGEFLIATILLLMLFITLCKTLAKALNGVKVSKKFIGYQGGEVPINHQ